ncbi:MAG: hypothetical protein JWO80_2962, partial [Bryobacterales bacterium]|nr:hypothetical protein [Bryobacterales bacterium]
MKTFGTAILLLASFGIPVCAADPDWPAVERHAMDLFRRYVRIQSVNPPADTRETAKLLQAEFA